MFDGVSLVKTTSEAPESQGIRKRIEEAFSWARTVAHSRRRASQAQKGPQQYRIDIRWYRQIVFVIRSSGRHGG